MRGIGPSFMYKGRVRHMPHYGSGAAKQEPAGAESQALVKRQPSGARDKPQQTPFSLGPDRYMPMSCRDVHMHNHYHVGARPSVAHSKKCAVRMFRRPKRAKKMDVPWPYRGTFLQKVDYFWLNHVYPWLAWVGSTLAVVVTRINFGFGFQMRQLPFLGLSK